MKLVFIDPWPPRTVSSTDSPLPRLTSPYLAAMALGAGHQVEVFDLQLLENDLAGLDELARTSSFDVVGLTMTTRQFVFASQILRRLKALLPNALFVAGGPHVTTRPEMTSSSGTGFRSARSPSRRRGSSSAD